MSDYEYEMREAREFQRNLREAEEGSLEERKDAAAEFFDAMRNEPDLVGERIGWLIDGNYGYGAMKASERVLRSPRSNRHAWLVQVIGALEWKAPGAMVRSAWKKLSTEQKFALEAAVDKEISDYERNNGIVNKSKRHRYQ